MHQLRHKFVLSSLLITANLLVFASPVPALAQVGDYTKQGQAAAPTTTPSPTPTAAPTAAPSPTPTAPATGGASAGATINPGTGTGTPIPPKDPIDIRQYSPFPEGTTLKGLITGTIPNFLIAFVGFVFMVYFLINAFRYLVSAGNSEGTTAAKNGMLSAIIGIIVVLTAFGVITVASRWVLITP